MSEPFPPSSQQPTYPSYPVYQPARPPTSPRRSLRWLWITLASVGGTIILCCALIVLLLRLPPPPASITSASNTPAVAHTTATRAATTPQPTATIAPATATPIRPTATKLPQPAVLTGATLGGTLAGFVAQYGPADSSGSQNASWGNVSIAGQSVSLDLSFDSGNDHQQHVVSVQAGPSGGGTWDTQTAFAVMQAMYPGDYTFVRNDTSNPNFDTRIEKSVRLGATLPASQFVNGGGSAVSIGEFNVACQLSGGQVSVCFMLPGEP